jgi:hypothetical protein
VFDRVEDHGGLTPQRGLSLRLFIRVVPLGIVLL